MPLAQLAGSVFLSGFPAGPLPAELSALAASDSLAGFVLFRRNVEGGASATWALCSELTQLREAPTILAVDQEGGRVERLREEVLRLPPMRRLGQHAALPLIEELACCLGTQLRALGFSMDFAPVLDVDTHPRNPVIGDRSFSSDPQRVAECAMAFARGLLKAEIAPCGKHFPGHGDTDLDSHLALPTLRHDRGRLDQVELLPFLAARSLPAWMSAHIVFSAIDAARPATLSPPVMTTLLREELGYEGVLISDDLEMRAVRDGWGIPESAVLAIAAGCDLLLVCSEPEALLAAREAVLREAEQSPAFLSRLKGAAARVDRLRRRFPARPSLERPALTIPAHLQGALSRLPEITP